MGQKVNPNGLRLGINRTWTSRWYSKMSYAKLLHEDLEIKKFVDNKLVSASISKIVIERAAKKIRLTIYSSRPGIIIGKKTAISLVSNARADEKENHKELIKFGF